MKLLIFRLKYFEMLSALLFVQNIYSMNCKYWFFVAESIIRFVAPSSQF